MDPQEALETSVVNLIRSSTADGGLALSAATCGRTFDGSPPPTCGQFFVAVWSDDGWKGGGTTYLSDEMQVYVTVTVRLSQPFDRWVNHRDEVRALSRQIRVIVGKDIYDHRVSRAANTLASLRLTDTGSLAQAVGVREPLVWERFDGVQMVGPDWFKANVAKGDTSCGLAQRVVFGRAKRYQNWANAE